MRRRADIERKKASLDGISNALSSFSKFEEIFFSCMFGTVLESASFHWCFIGLLCNMAQPNQGDLS